MHNIGHGVPTAVIPALRRWSQKDQESKEVSLVYMMFYLKLKRDTHTETNRVRDKETGFYWSHLNVLLFLIMNLDFMG